MENDSGVNLKEEDHLGATVMIVDDDELLRRSLAFSLQHAGFEPLTAGSAEDALAILARRKPDIILLDIMLPGMDGLEALRQFREQYGIPVIFLSARRRELDQVLGLELGADDYLTKPFDPDVLIAHVHAVLRRVKSVPRMEQKPEALRVGALLIDPRARTVTVGNRVVDCSPKEYDLLYTLALEPGRVFTQEELITRVWGADFTGEPQVVYVIVRWLREKIEHEPQNPVRLLTVRGVGYKLVAPEGET
jgi:DNA-binding response OmpR family regulator